MKPSLRVLIALLFPVGLMSLGPSGCKADGLIGGECADGYEFCDGACISITDDELNCGGCDRACPRNLACIDALCGGPDGTVTVPGSGGMGGSGLGGDGPGVGGNGFGGIDTGDGDRGDGTGGDGTGASTGDGDGDGAGGTDGTGGGGPVCVPPFNTAQFCGDCDTQCTGMTPNCSSDGDGGYECVSNCLIEPFTTECRSQCVDTTNDPRHCGGCDNRCESGICIDSACIGEVSGHMAALCMSFESQSPAQTNLLGNGVFLATSNPVRILAYVREATPQVINGTNLALSTAAAAKGVTYQKTQVTGLNSVTNQLDRANYDVLIVYDQPTAPSGQMAARAAAWAPTIDQFTRLGGVVIVLTGGGGTSEMHDLISGLGVVDTTGATNYDGNSYEVTSPGDALAIGVVSPFLAVPASCVFDGTPMAAGDLIYVTEGATPGPGVGNPGVVHRIVVP